MHPLAYICPVTKVPLTAGPQGLVRPDGTLIPYLPNSLGQRPIPNFRNVQPLGPSEQRALQIYDERISTEYYRNELDWLLASFETDETALRRSLTARLQLAEGARVLVTGCGLGGDLPAIRSLIGKAGQIYAQDISVAMVTGAQDLLAKTADGDAAWPVFFSVGDAAKLPFPDNFFDGAYHFGGINLFADIQAAIAEMDRVVRPGGRVVFGDEGIGPWLRDKEYGKIGLANNPLWAASPPLELLPETALDVHVHWILGNFFYVIDFEVSDAGPRFNIDVVHKGRRGGCARSRYFGQLEGVTPETKQKVREAAAAMGLSVHDWLEQAIAKAL